MKIQSDGKGYGKPTEKNPFNMYEGNLNPKWKEWDDAHPKLPIYLPNGDPYLGDDVVEGERGFMQSNEDAEGKTIWRRCWNPHLATSDTMDCYIANPVLTEQAEVKTDISNRAKSNRRVIQLIFEDSNRISYYPTIAILDFYQDKDRLSYKKSDVIKLRDFLNQLPL